MNKDRLLSIIDRFLIIKRVILYGFMLVVAIIIYRYLARFIASDGNTIKGLTALWLVTAYLVLPRIHRILSKIYLPDYFIGRVRTSDGLLGDPVNLAIIGSEKELRNAMEAAGWHEADYLNFGSTLKMIKSSILKRSYPTAPVSSLFLFNKKQQLAYQQEVDNNPHKRHHVRFWRCPDGWYLPGGHNSDWLGAATYDRRVGLSAYTLQFTHKIEEDTDIERDYVVATVKKSNPKSKVKVVDNFSSGYHHRNGGGDSIKTDGALPFIKLSS